MRLPTHVSPPVSPHHKQTATCCLPRAYVQQPSSESRTAASVYCVLVCDWFSVSIPHWHLSNILATHWTKEPNQVPLIHDEPAYGVPPDHGTFYGLSTRDAEHLAFGFIITSRRKLLKVIKCCWLCLWNVLIGVHILPTSLEPWRSWQQAAGQMDPAPREGYFVLDVLCLAEFKRCLHLRNFD